MRLFSKRLVKLAKYSTNEPKEVTVDYFHVIPLPKEDVDFILGQGPNKEERQSKLQFILNNYNMNQALKNYQLVEEILQLKDKVTIITEKWNYEIVQTKDEIVQTKRKAKDEIVQTKRRVATAKDEVVQTKRKVAAAKDEVVQTERKAKEKIVQTEHRVTTITEK